MWGSLKKSNEIERRIYININIKIASFKMMKKKLIQKEISL